MTALKRMMDKDEDDIEVIKKEFNHINSIKPHPNLVEYKGLYLIPDGSENFKVIIEMTLGDSDIITRIEATVYFYLTKF